MRPIEIVFLYCLSDDLLRYLGIEDDLQCKMTSAEIVTVALVAARFFGGRLSIARRFLQSHKYIPKMLSHSRLNRRMHEIKPETWRTLFQITSWIFQRFNPASEFIVDSFPIQACHPCRSWRCKLFTGKNYIGYCASKKQYYYGLKIHIITSVEGNIVEFFFTPASVSDVTAFQDFDLELPENSYLYADKAYTCYDFEDVLKECFGVFLIAQRKRNSRRPHALALQAIQRIRRKSVETSISQVCRFLPRGICARSAKGFELRLFLFVFSYALERLQKLYLAAA